MARAAVLLLETLEEEVVDAAVEVVVVVAAAAAAAAGATKAEIVAAIETSETDVMTHHPSETTVVGSVTEIGGIATGILFVVVGRHQVPEDPRRVEIFEIVTSKLASRLTGLDADQEMAGPLVQDLHLLTRLLHHNHIEDPDFVVVAVDGDEVIGTAVEDVHFMKTVLIASEAVLKRDAGAPPETETNAITTDSWIPTHDRANY